MLLARGLTTREQVRKQTAKPKPGRPKSYTFSYRAPSKAYTLKLNFRRGHVQEDDVIEALEAIIAELRAAKKK